MLKRFLIASATVVAAGLIILFISQQSQPSESLEERYERLRAEAKAGSRDNPIARAEFLLNRIVDPQTGSLPRDIFRRETEFAAGLPKRRYLGKSEAAVWGQRGPRNVGGRTRALAVDVSNTSNIIAGGVSGGLWRSTDGGTTWSQATGIGQLRSVTSLVQDTRTGKTNIWYAGSGEWSGNSASGGGAAFRGDGVWKSTDGGASWNLLASTSTNTPHSFDQLWDYVHEVAVDPSNAANDEVYAATYSGIHRSLDGGTSWAEVLDGLSSPSFSPWTDVAVTSGGVVYAAFESDGAVDGVYRSTTGASSSFVDITPGLHAGYQRTELAIHPSNENQVWVLLYWTSGISTGHELWKYRYLSGDGTGSGGIWTDYSSFVPARGGFTGTFDSQGGYDLVVKTHPTDSNIVFIGGTNLFRIDVSGTAGVPGDGDTWIGGYDEGNVSFAIYNGTNGVRQHPDQHAIAFLPPPWGPSDNDPDIMWVGSDGGVHRTDNSLAAGDGNVNYTDLNGGYFTTQFYSICMNSNAVDPFVGGGMQDNGSWGTTSFSPSVDWTEQSGGDGGFCQVVDKSTGTRTIRYLSSQLGVLYRQEYLGNVRLTFDRIDPAGGSSYLFISPFIVDPTDEKILYHLESLNIWRASNAETASTGSGWTNLSPTFPSPPDGTFFTAIGVSTGPTAHTVYLGTSGCEIYRLDNAHSATSGVLLTDLTAAPLPAACYVSDIAVDPTDDQNVLVAISNYNTASLFYTSDGGSSWQDVEGNLSGAAGPSVRSVAILPGASTPYFAGTSVGLYSASSLSGATVWSQEGPSTIGNVVINMVRARGDGTILAGTHGNGTFSSVVTLAVEISDLLALSDDEGVVLRWETVSEVDNVGFDVEVRPAGDEVFTAHGFVKGHGTTTASHKYEYRLGDLLPGLYDLRLSQIDADGRRNTTEIVSTRVEVPGTHLISDVYPNPAVSTATVNVAVVKPQRVTVDVFDVAGRQVMRVFSGDLDPDRTTRVRLDVGSLAQGTYILRASGEDFRESRMFVAAGR